MHELGYMMAYHILLYSHGLCDFSDFTKLNTLPILPVLLPRLSRVYIRESIIILKTVLPYKLVSLMVYA